MTVYLSQYHCVLPRGLPLSEVLQLILISDIGRKLQSDFPPCCSENRSVLSDDRYTRPAFSASHISQRRYDLLLRDFPGNVLKSIATKYVWLMSIDYCTIMFDSSRYQTAKSNCMCARQTRASRHNFLEKKCLSRS